METNPTIHVVAGTGSRSLETATDRVRREASDLVANELTTLAERYGDRLVVMSGMAEGFDKLLALHALHTDLRLWCAIPNRGYGAHYWGEKSATGMDQLREFDRIVDSAWRVTYVMEDIHHKSGLYLNGVHSNFVRNDFMVATADEFLVWDPRTSGTKQCLETIIAAQKPHIVLV